MCHEFEVVNFATNILSFVELIITMEIKNRRLSMSVMVCLDVVDVNINK